MFKKVSRYYYALKYLKPIQIRYQIWYRVRNKLFPLKYPEKLFEYDFQKITLTAFPEQHSHYLDKKHFQFLNLDHHFANEIDWNYSGFGKLWAYHLNYFEYLLQPGMSWEVGSGLIDNFLKDVSARSEGLEPYPVSLRTINWIKFLAVHKKFPRYVINSLYTQYYMLSKRLEYHLLGNHLLENGFSLLFGAVLFKNKRLSKLCKSILVTELNEQILKDGAHFELSPMYHKIILQRALDSYNLLINNSHTLKVVEVLLKEKIQLMVNWLISIRFDSGDLPHLNDSVEGQALQTQSLLNYAGSLGFKAEETHFFDSGYRKLKNSGFELVADVGEIGPGYQPGHAHSDSLSFVLHYQGKPLIVDPGISTYQKNSRRNLERSTTYHNTVIINDEEQSDVWGGFRVGRRANVVIKTDKEDFLEAFHNGYLRHGILHNRTWEFLESGLRITDQISGSPKSSVASFHLDYKVEMKQLSESSFKVFGLILSFKGYESVKIDDYLYCLGFNKYEKGKVLRVAFNKSLISSFSI